MWTRAAAVLLTLLAAQAFAPSSLRRPQTLLARKRSSEAGGASETPIAGASKPAIVVGADLPEEILKMAVIYDMLLVERFSEPSQTVTGLFLPKVEGKDRKHTALVLSCPTEYGLESEQGRVQSPAEIAPYGVGDTVLVRDPWGVGPKDVQIGERCFSFHKAAQITGVVRKAKA